MDTPLIQKTNEPLSRYLRLFIFCDFILLSIVMSGDNGVLSSSKKIIREDLGLDEKLYGVFSSIPSIGRIAGSFIFMYLLSFDNRKLITVICLTINGSLFFVYYLTRNKWILFCVRALIGTVRIFPHIYIPVWVDQFGIKKLKTMFMTIINITSPLGQTVGYILGNIRKKEEWYINYCYVGGLILIISCGIFFSPSKYFSAKYNWIGYKNEDNDNIIAESKNWKLISYFENGEFHKKEKKHGSMLVLLKKPVYILSAYTKSNIFFIFQIIHLNISGHAEDGLGISQENQITTITPFYSAASTLGPVIGGMTGGSIVSYFGGYEKKNSAYCLAIFASLTLIGAILTAYSTYYVFLGIGLFVFFFFASAFLPIIGGYVVNSIPKEHKGAGSSLNLLLTNLGGNLPGPIVFGFLNDFFKAKGMYSAAWKIVIHYYVIGLLTAFGAAYFRFKELSKIERGVGEDGYSVDRRVKGEPGEFGAAKELKEISLKV